MVKPCLTLEEETWERLGQLIILHVVSQRTSNTMVEGGEKVTLVYISYHAQWFSTWKYQAGQAPRVQSYHLRWLGKNWLKPQVNSVDEVIDKVTSQCLQSQGWLVNPSLPPVRPER
uniref:SCAN box domain-containing protein n=1 Tax=Oncorhynchus mykiss TaxID=8022 RepID=A0A8K9VAC3_ONCMY